MHRSLTKLGRSLLSSSIHCLPTFSSTHLSVHPLYLMRSLNTSVTPLAPIFHSGFHLHFPQIFPAQVPQSRYFATKKKRSRAPDTPVVSKVKKYKMKTYSSFKSRFKTLSNGQIWRWHAGKRHNAHLKSKKSKRRLRKPALVHLAYAKVMKKLNFAG